VEKGVSEFFSECDGKLCENVFGELNLGTENSDDTVESHLKEIVVDEVILGGVEDFFMTFPRQLLEGWCTDYDIIGTRQLRPREIVDKLMSVIFQLEPLEEWKRRRDPSPSSTSSSRSPPTSPREKKKLKRPRSQSFPEKEIKRRRGPYVCPPLSNIQFGISKEELHNLYNLTDLQQWCKDQHIDSVGKKSLVINRIYTFLETGAIHSIKKTKKQKQRH